ncbi:MAG: hypothetical protein GTO02_08390 [Candidatus Dadabacteria bacterium]|nr:hypothetical protein [Candidatus Dadabacteria bacterium]
MKIMNNIITGVERLSILVITLLVITNILIGHKQLAYGIAIGGLLFTADYTSIRFIVKSLIEKKYSLGFGVFLLVIKLLILGLILVSLFLFAKVNIYGFIIGLTAVVIIIIGKGLKDKNHGTL